MMYLRTKSILGFAQLSTVDDTISVSFTRPSHLVDDPNDDEDEYSLWKPGESVRRVIYAVASSAIR